MKTSKFLFAVLSIQNLLFSFFTSIIYPDYHPRSNRSDITNFSSLPHFSIFLFPPCIPLLVIDRQMDRYRKNSNNWLICYVVQNFLLWERGEKHQKTSRPRQIKK